MLKIKLSRIGKKNKPMYRLIISEHTKDPYGNSLEILGSYNPHTKELQAKQERIKYWISKGAQMTPTINNLLIEQKIIEGDKVKASKAGTKKKQAKESAEPKPVTPEEPKVEEKAEEPKVEEKAEENNKTEESA